MVLTRSSTSLVTRSGVNKSTKFFYLEDTTSSARKRIKKEDGCTEPLTGEKSKCVLHIVPRNKSCKTFQMDKQCEKVKIVNA